MMDLSGKLLFNDIANRIKKGVSGMRRFSAIWVWSLMIILSLFSSCALADSAIRDMDVKGNSLYVEWQSTEDAMLTVEIVEEGETQPYASKSIMVSGEEQYGEKNIVFQSLPEYFTIEAYFSPVSGGTGSEGKGNIFVEDLYTKPVQDLIRSDGSEYKAQYGDRYLEFFIDEYGNKSFGVLDENFTVVRTSKLKGHVSITPTDTDKNGVLEQLAITMTDASQDAAWFENLKQIGDGVLPAYVYIVDDQGRTLPDYRYPDSLKNPIQYHMLYLDSATEIDNGNGKGLLLTNIDPPEPQQRSGLFSLSGILEHFNILRIDNTWDKKNQRIEDEDTGYFLDFDTKGSISIKSIFSSARRIEINNDFNFRKIQLTGEKEIKDNVKIFYYDPSVWGIGHRIALNMFLNFKGGQSVDASMSGNMKHTFNLSGQSGGTRIDHVQFHPVWSTGRSDHQELTIEMGPQLEAYLGIALGNATIKGNAYTKVKLVQGQKSNDDIWHGCAAGIDNSEVVQCVEGFPEHRRRLDAIVRASYLFGTTEVYNGTLLESEPKKGKEFYHSERYNTSGEGLCPYKGYRTEVYLKDANGELVKDYECSYTPVRPEFMSVASSVVSSDDGNKNCGVLFIPASNTPVTVQVTYTTPAGVKRTMSQTIVKRAETSEVIFQIDENEYWLIYDDEGEPVDNMPEAVSCRQDDIFPISTRIPVMENRRFAGWSFRPMSDPRRQVDYKPGDPFWMSDQLFGESNIVRLYPVWEGVSYLYYTLKPEDRAEVNPLTMPWTGVNEKFISPMIPQKEGDDEYFVGWMDDKSILPNLPLMPNPYYPESGTLTAQFVSTAFMEPNVTFDEGNHAEGSVFNMPQAVNTTVGVPFKLPAKIPFLVALWSVDVPQFFVGWSLFKDSKIPTFFPGMDFVALKDTTLYAVWVDRPDFYLLSYDANGGSGAPWTGLNSKTISTTVPTRPGHKFMGWVKDEDLNNNEQPKEGAVRYQPGNPNPFYQVVENKGGKPERVYRSGTLYAVWEERDDVYTVSFNANGGLGAPDSVTGKKDTAVTIPNQLPKPPVNQMNAQFAGWGISENAPATVQPGESYTGSEDITLYAQWKTGELTVYYDANGGSGAPGMQTFSEDAQDKLLSQQVPVREGYQFEGWSVDPNAKYAKYQPGSQYDGMQSVVLYAVWEADKLQTVVITYDANGGEHAPEAQHVSVGQTAMLSEQIPIKAGYRFMGWAEDEQAEEAYYHPGEAYLFNADVTFYAVWDKDEPKMFTITYDANGGDQTSAPQSQSAFWGETVKLPMDVPVRENHIFMGWALAKDAAQDEYQPGDELICKGNVTLYALWSRDAFKIYTVSYDANGGYEDSVPAAESAFKGERITLSEHIPTRLYHHFKGWALDPDAKEASLQPGARFVSESDTTLYAVWEASIYKLTYNANGGSGAPEEQTGFVGENVTLSMEIPVRNHCTFLGWAKNPNAPEAEEPFEPGKTVAINGHVTLYAVWDESKATPYTVTYHGNGSDVSGSDVSNVPAVQTVFEGDDVTIPDQRPARDKYVFMGWALSQEAETAQFDMGETFICTGNLDLYAVWSPDYTKMYTVSYHANGGTGAPQQQTAFRDGTITISAQEPEREGYAFAGWAKEQDAAIAAYLPGGEFTYDGNALTILYAVWARDPGYYQVTYDANGGAGAPDPQYVPLGTHVLISRMKPTRDDDVFIGWSENRSDQAGDYQPGMAFISDVDVTLYAVWADASSVVYTVTYDANGGINPPQPQLAAANSTIRLSDQVPVKQGCEFKGWALSDSASSAEVLNPEYTVSANVTLYAVWEASDAIYTVTYDANRVSGAIIPALQTGIKGTQIQLSTIVPLAQDWHFVGWTLESDKTIPDYLPGDTFPPDGSADTAYVDTTLYAIWYKDPDGQYTVTYDAKGGTGAPHAQTGYIGRSIQISSQQPIREGYLFKGWATDEAATTVAYEAGDYFPDGSNPVQYRDTTLYAVWKEDPAMVYTITYHLKGGAGTFEPQTAFIGSSIQLYKHEPTHSTMAFCGWALDEDNEQVMFDSGESCSFTKDTDLFAVWEPKRYTITYDANGGKGAPQPQSAQINTPITLHDQTYNPMREHYEFIGWATNPLANAGDKRYQPNEEYRGSDDVTLYAIWQPEQDKLYTVRYHANGGYENSVPQPQEAVEGEAITLSLQRPVYPDHTFGGWMRSSNGTAADFQPGQYYSEYESIDLYALWTNQPRTILFDDNGGKNGPGSQTFLGETTTIVSIVPWLEDHRFEGWSLSAVPLQIVCAAPGEEFVWPEGNADMQLTLYAVWTYDPSYQPEEPDLPETGDSSALTRWFALMVLSGGGILLMSKHGRRRRN